MDCTIARSVPTVFLSRRDDEFSVRVGSQQFRYKSARREIDDSLTMSKKLIPISLFEGTAVTVIFGQERFTPQIDIRRIFKEAVHVIRVVKAQLLES